MIHEIDNDIRQLLAETDSISEVEERAPNLNIQLGHNDGNWRS